MRTKWRDAQRAALEQTIAGATAELAVADQDVATRARSSLVRAHAAKAEDALYGAGQLSRGAQRAPTLDACDDGWERVEEIVQGAETSARAASLAAAELEREAQGTRVARDALAAAGRARAAALAARKIIDERNHAYTFHTAGGFSFGEGWYLAAGALLAGVDVQLEPGASERVAQAERFLADAGLARRIVPYRPRPRAMKQVTELVARAFRDDPLGARARVRAAFLGDGPIAGEVGAWVDRRLALAAAPDAKKVLIWVRDGAHQPGRNSTYAEILELVGRARQAGLVPVLVGDALRGERTPAGAVDLLLFWQAPLFSGVEMRRAQLHFFEHLRSRHALVGQLGVTTAGMDGPALTGLPTLYLTDAPNPRMREWVGAVPGYVEVVRESGYLERITQALCDWARP